jgi:hypothetical protein
LPLCQSACNGPATPNRYRVCHEYRPRKHAVPAFFPEFSVISGCARPCFLAFASIEFASRGLLWRTAAFLLFGGYKDRSHKAC